MMIWQNMPKSKSQANPEIMKAYKNNSNNLKEGGQKFLV